MGSLLHRLPCWGAQALGSMGLVAPQRVGSSLNQGWDPRSLHWQENSQPLDRQQSLSLFFFSSSTEEVMIC